LCYKKKESGLSQKRDQPVLVVIGSQNKNPMADFLDQFVCARYFWNSSNFVIIFSFIEKWMKNFEINTID